MNIRKKKRNGVRWSIISIVVVCTAMALMPLAQAAEGHGSEGRGGSWVGLFSPSLGEFNDKLEGNGFPRLDGTFVLFGGSGYATFDSFKMGGFGAGGALIAEEGMKRSELSMGFGAFQAARVWSLERVKLEVGGVIGGGGATIVLSDGSPSSGDDAISNRYDTVIDRGFWLVGPTIGARYDITNFVSVHVGAGYLHTMGDWKHRGGDATLTGLPDLSGTYVSLGVALGGFHQ